MKCHGCGHEFVKTLSRCPRCHRSTSNPSLRRGRASTDSRLLEFPRKTRYAAPIETPASVPAWRAELTEKVRAIRARRTADPQPNEVTEQTNHIDIERQTSATVLQQPEPAISYSPNVIPRKATQRTSPIESEAPTISTRRTSSNIVEAALIRVKRASENASRAALPKIEPARSMQTNTQVGLAVGATARALEPEPEVESRPEPEIAPMPERTASPRPELVEAQAQVKATSPLAPPLLDPRVEEPTVEDSPEMPSSSAAIETKVLILDEIEPIDYLEAEIRKVDQAYGSAFLKNESPSIFTHAVIVVADLLALAASCAPFLAIIRIADGNFAAPQTRITAGAVVAVITFFYFLLTQGLCGRTFGMMLTNTRIVDAQTFEAPSHTRALARTVGYFLAMTPAMLGIIWAAFNTKRRGWQDFVSGTIVVRDF